MLCADVPNPPPTPRLHQKSHHVVDETRATAPAATGDATRQKQSNKTRRDGTLKGPREACPVNKLVVEVAMFVRT